MIRKVVNYYILLMDDFPFIPGVISTLLEIPDVVPKNSGLFLNYAMETPRSFYSVRYSRNVTHPYTPSVSL